MSNLTELLEALGSGRRTSRELQTALGCSQSSVSRLIAEAGERVVRLGARRSASYAAARPLFGSGFALPLFEVDALGEASEIGVLRGLAGGEFLVEGDRLPVWLRGEAGNGVFPGLPYFLDDLRPAGFLGRLFARRIASTWGFAADPRDWLEEQLGRCLLHAGEALPGNLILGEGAAARLRVWTTERVLSPETEYPGLADRVLAGDMPGSSAAGEQPKFTAWREDVGHVLVKFSPSGRNPEAQRWRDLLHAEYHALAALRASGIDAAQATIFSGEGRVFLELRRFDRTGAYGRHPMISLAAVDAEFAGEGRDWTRSASALHNSGLIDADTRTRIEALQGFGEGIGNTDMHLGNISLRPCADNFALLPVYDMLPMALAPRHGEIPSSLPPRPAPSGLPRDITDVLQDYRRRLREDDRVSRKFRVLAEE